KLHTGERDWIAVGTLAATLAHVKTHEPRLRTARIFGEPGKAGGARAMSEQRFRRLLQAEEGAERMAALRRALALVGGRANVPDLAESLLNWTERTRIRRLFDYYGTTPPGSEPAPESDTNPTAELETTR
ncbi:MAG: type I-E CRISPR-associated protein Cse2/CasB, partial [Pseudomonadales bacterium]|nr:type I-E CRISPR-associated protein Cse2/CasB [Pseudomonadales bacterium]